MLPSDDEILNLCASGDVLRHAIVGFSAIERALEELISSSLLASHKLEMRNISIGFKVDLLIGLGLMSRDSKGLLVKLSKIRNFYAHEFNSETEYCSHQELKSCLSNSHRSIIKEYFDTANTFKEVLRISIFAAYYEIVNLIEHQRKLKTKRAEAHLRMLAVLDVAGMTKEEHERVTQTDSYKQLARRVEKRKAEMSLEKSGKPDRGTK